MPDEIEISEERGRKSFGACGGAVAEKRAMAGKIGARVVRDGIAETQERTEEMAGKR